MPQRRHVARAVVTASAAATCLALATPAWASAAVTNPTLRQANQHILANDNGFNEGFGKCAGADQQAGQDIWVFIWPGNKVESVDAVKIGWDTDNNGTADTFKTLADGHFTTDNGAKKVWFATPTGWKLESGESTIHGQVPQDRFNLTHTCAGTSTSTGSPSPSASSTGSPTPTPTTPGEETPTPTPGGSENPSENPSGTPAPGTSVGGGQGGGSGTEGGLPLTGVAATSISLTGLALIGGGVLLMVLRRRRDRITFTS
ncbi:LPXTG cell wall anchor domain-containing protein [Micromonospora sp. MA102]|uniref:LPXTG cell wall anchor domain-containing protein n=1 Tax=Micromonospora sp. MA102 TaxID=2952755 RepID=UPI0021C9D96D|nr:LPXTG cell wall anchor domain-containing protein [Micromonospora sp. MA102]